MSKDITEEQFKKNQHIDSVKYSEKINSIMSQFQLTKKTGITNFCVCFIFKDGSKYFLSNMPDWAIEYHKMGGARCDEVFDLSKMNGYHYFFPRMNDYDDLQIISKKRRE